jgi:hypothetical protein
VKEYNCSCGNKNCKRKVRSNKQGRLYAVNHFQCNKVKKIMEECIELIPPGNNRKKTS